MILDERKKRILRAIIDDYIKTAEPVGSRTIARKHSLGLSSATIRNEMADLEEMGFLIQPHTSAGRIPSDSGYRLYVDELMKLRTLTPEEVEAIKEGMEIKITELGQLVKRASSIMSHITHYTSIAVTPRMKETKIKAVQVVPIDSHKVLVILVATTGLLRNSLIQVSQKVTPYYTIRISNILNDKVTGLTIEQLDADIENEIGDIMGKDREIVSAVLDGVRDCISQLQNLDVYLEGTTNIFDFPEFSDVFKAREFLNMLDTKDTVCRLLGFCNGQRKGIRIRIGSENDIEEVKDYTLVTASYNVDNSVLGTIGIIGPTRMEYSRVVVSLNYIRKKINDDLRKLLGEDEKDNK